MTPPTPPPPRRDDPPSEPFHRSSGARRARRRVLLAAFGVSILLHALLVLLYPLLVGPPDPGAASSRAEEEDPRPRGTEIVRIVEVPEERLERPDVPESERRPVPRPPRPTALPPSEEAGPARGEEEAEGLTAAERVRATAPDVRLLTPLSDETVALSPEQVARLELTWALEELNDSAAAVAEAARRARDWTYTDDDGKRWGVSSEGIHLGGVTLPLPNFGAPYDPEAWKGSMDADLARAAGSAAARETQEERAKAIRERKERERRERADTTRGGGSWRQNP